jgi:hypothetical protein
MSNASKKAFYWAALLDPSAPAGRKRDFTSLAVAYAESDDEAVNLAVNQGEKWLLAHGIDCAVLHIVRDDQAFYNEPLYSAK